MTASTGSLPGLRQCIHWKHIFIAAICLMALHLFLFGGIRLPSELNATSADPATTGSSSDRKPNVVTEPQNFHNEQFVNANSQDGRLALPPDGVSDTEDLAICLYAQDQALDLAEFFVHHYHHMGVRRFYVMDDNSTPPLSEAIYPGVPRTALTFNYQAAKGKPKDMQVTGYTRCIEWYKDRHEWMGFIDANEFVDTPGNETLREVLATFEDEMVGAVGFNWRTHTSSNLIERPPSVRKNFTMCTYDDLEHSGANTQNRHIRSFVRMRYVVRPNNSFKFSTTKGTETVGEDGESISTIAFRTPVSRNRVGIHRYATKSKAQYVQRLTKLAGKPSTVVGDPMWEDIEEKTPHVECTEMRAYDP